MCLNSARNWSKDIHFHTGTQHITNVQTATPKTNKTKIASKNYGGLSQHDYDILAKLEFKSGSMAYVTVNNNKSTLIKKAWTSNQVIYANLDNLNRTSHSNTAFLEKRNLATGNLRVRQFINPTAWHFNHGKNQIYNRGHLVAYSISAGIDQGGIYNPKNKSGDQNNPKNLFTQTAFSNQEIQTIFEGKIRASLRQNKRVIFQATPIFRGNELMARGINLQVISTDGHLNFNVYIFNVQPNFAFNYANGRVKIDHSMQVKYF